jgi:hypothetical protein
VVARMKYIVTLTITVELPADLSEDEFEDALDNEVCELVSCAFEIDDYIREGRFSR